MDTLIVHGDTDRYSDLAQRYRIPPLTDDVGQEKTVIRRMTVDLPTLLVELQGRSVDNAPLRPRKIIILCDVLTMGRQAGERPMTPDAHLLIFSRRVDVSGPARLVVNANRSVTWYANEWSGSLRLVANDPQADTIPEMDVTSLRGFGFLVRAGGGTMSKSDLANFGLMREGGDLATWLENTFLYASAEADEHPGSAPPMLQWIRRATASWPEMQQLYLQASALLCSVPNRPANAAFVPWLSKEVYDQETRAFIDAARQYEANYDAFHAANAALDQQARYAQLMLDNFKDTETVARKIATQIQANLDEEEGAVAVYQTKVTEQQFLIKRAELAFQQGIARYQAEKKLEFGLQIAGAVVSLGVAAGSAAVGVPDTAALSALGSAVKAGKTTKEAAETLEKLGKLGEQLAKMYESLKTIMEAARRLQSLSELSSMVVTEATAGTDTDNASWDIFRDRVVELVQPAIDEKIEGAVDYKLALTSLAVYAKALNQSKASYITTARELARQLLQQAALARQAARMTDYIAELKAGQQPNEEMMRWLLQRYNTVKRWLLIALQHHNDAYRYWALQEPATALTFSSRVGEMCEAYAGIVRGEAEALETFQPPPQDFQNYRVEVTDPAAVSAFIAARRITVEVTPDHKTFARRERVRLRYLRVWLEGARATDSIRVSITGSGAYRDRFRGRTMNFVTAWPLELTFEYAAPREILMDAGFASQYRASYFEPTPFTSWTIAVEDPAVTLTAISKIVLEFAGTAIARG